MAPKKLVAAKRSSKDLKFYNSLELAQMTVAEVENSLKTDLMYGLNTDNVQRRHTIFGRNAVTLKPPDPWWRKLLLNFCDPLIILLLLSALISFVLSNVKDGVSITVSVLIVVIVGFLQDLRSEKSLQKLKDLMPPSCKVMRNGILKEVLAADLVPGDIVILNTGDRVPADLRLFDCADLTIDESNFTGETRAMRKNAQVVTGELTSSDQTRLQNIAFMGTLVITGNSRGIVANCGDNTEFGEIVRMMQSEEAPITPLRQAMRVLSIQLTFMAVVIICIIGVIGILQGRDLQRMFNIGVSLAVAAIPEGLPIVVMVTLALGVIRMAKRNAIVKNLTAVETLGCVNVICSDKTGTLTQNAMTASIILSSDGVFADISGSGYSTTGKVSIRDNIGPIRNPWESVYRILEIALICNNAQVNSDSDILGSPTEMALVVAAFKNNMHNVLNQYMRLKEESFSSETKFMRVECVRRDDAEQKSVFFMKGALDVILEHCTHQMLGRAKAPLTKYKIEEFVDFSQQLGRQGLRVLGFAYGDISNEMCFCGAIGITDPPRPNLRHAIRIIADSGVRVIMITGDAQETAVAIATKIGMDFDKQKILPGYKLDEIDEQTCIKLINEVNIFYRVTPRHKLIIVKTLQSCKFIVAMTGDGVNDSIALKKADIGIAMGKKGTDVCKEAADMVLVDDNFLTILSAIEEGKSIFYNIRNFVRFQMTVSMAALGLVALCFFLNQREPLTPTQILWINIIMDGPPAQSLGLEPVDHDVMLEKPRSLKKPMVTRVFIASVVFDAVLFVILVYLVEIYDSQQHTHTTMTFTGFVVTTFFLALTCRSYTKNIFFIKFFGNRTFTYTILICFCLQVIVIYTPGVQMIFDTDNIDIIDWCIIFAAGFALLIVSEFKKYVVVYLRKNFTFNRENTRPPYPNYVEQDMNGTEMSVKNALSEASTAHFDP